MDNTPLTDHLKTLPTETLESIAALTHTLRIQRELQVRDTNTLKQMLLMARRNKQRELGDLIRAELDGRADEARLAKSLKPWERV